MSVTLSEKEGEGERGHTSRLVSKGENSCSTKSILATFAALQSVAADMAERPMYLHLPACRAASIAATDSSTGVFLSIRWSNQASGAEPRLRIESSMHCSAKAVDPSVPSGRRPHLVVKKILDLLSPSRRT